MTTMGVMQSMTTAHRAQADGKTERQNLVLEDALRCLVSYGGENRAKLLGTVEYAHATSVTRLLSSPCLRLIPEEKYPI